MRSRSSAGGTLGPPADREFVFNVVWTGDVFEQLQPFVCSLMERSAARFRFVANGCTDDSLELIHRFAESRPADVVAVEVVSRDDMVAHGVALDRTFERCDDGDFFCFVDTDIKANAPFVADFAKLLTEYDAVTSGNELWTDDNVVPDGSVGVGGRHFYDRHGNVFGSPHLGMYYRAALADTISRWNVGFGSAGPDIPDPARTRLSARGYEYNMYDTGKVVNILFQADGNRLYHHDHPELVHIGGLADFLCPPGSGRHGRRDTMNRKFFPRVGDRHELSGYTASVITAVRDDEPVPEIPADAEPRMAQRMRRARDEMVDLFAKSRPC